MDSFTILLILGCALLLISIFVTNTTNPPQACTMEAKLCPDGSAVGRDSYNNCSFMPCPHAELIKYCGNGARTVEASGPLIKADTSKSFIVYSSNVTVCNLSNMTNDCKALTHLSWINSINCTLASPNDIYSCPTNYYTFHNYSWINCKDPIPENFTSYCNNTYKQWIGINCPDINIDQ